MNRVKWLTIGASICLSLVAGVVVARSVTIGEPAPVKRGNGFAVLELFTSEGCSSCPPADALLGNMAKETNGKAVYVLTWHVDYWDRLGWKDVFSDQRYSKRQYDYARQLSAQVYTPQLVVNGKAELVGADEPAVRKAQQDALNTPAAVTLSLTGRYEAGKLSFDYGLSGRVDRSQLLVAVVQKQAVSKVARGENAGRTLPHAQIVRDFHTYDLKGITQGRQQIDLPAGFNTNEWEIIGIIQNNNTGGIEGAARMLIEGTGGAAAQK